MPSVFTLHHNQYDILFNEFEGTLGSLTSSGCRQEELLFKLSDLLERTRNAFEELKKEGIESKKKCLEHIEILLYQRDYQEALKKIDYYKNNPEADVSVEVTVS